jgi:DNA-binding response OmpR family regulator
MAVLPDEIAVATSYPPLGRFVSLALKVEGYEPHLFVDGEQALEALLSQPFAAAILGADLAKVSGFEICQRLRAVSSIPVILLLMRGDARQQMQGRKVGASALLFIPFDAQELLICLSTVLPNSNRPASEQA